jgi:uncharacterized protein YbaP (TraB family)
MSSRSKPLAGLRALAGLCLLAAVGCAAPAAAEPAMWVARDADTTIYLFGTVHVLRPNVAWKTPRLAQAFSACRELNLEINDTDDAAATSALVLKYGMDLGHPLSAKLNAQERARFAAAAATIGVPVERLDLMRPWLAGVTLSLAPILHAGYDPSSGVEEALKADAAKRGEPVKGLETSEAQIRILAGLPEADQLTFLREALDDFDKAPEELDHLAAAWQAGRVDQIDSLANKDMRKDAPLIYRLLLADRNAGFARQVKTMLDRPGAYCVAVGAAHFAGPDSIQEKLKAVGVKTDRY